MDRQMRDTETLNRIERLANEFIWQNEWLGVLNVSKTTDGEIIKIHMGDDELYGDYDLKIKVEFEKNGEDSQQKIFTEVCGLYGLKPDDYGKTFVHFEGLGKLEKQYQLLGINVSAPKYPIIVKDLESNQMYRMPKETFQMFKRK